MIIKARAVTDTKKRTRDLNRIFIAQVLLRFLTQSHIKSLRAGNFDFLKRGQVVKMSIYSRFDSRLD